MRALKNIWTNLPGTDSDGKPRVCDSHKCSKDFEAHAQSARINGSVSKAMDYEQSNWHKGVPRVTVQTIPAVMLCFMRKLSR
jgi:hypothetical protein